MAHGLQSSNHDLDIVDRMDEMVADHLRVRITKQGRYLPESIEEALFTTIAQWRGSSSKSMRTQLLEVL